jgi:WD40 repeat protein
MQAPIREHILTKNVIEKVYVTGQNEFMRVVGNGISFESLSGVEEEREKQVWIQNQQGSSGVACVSVDLCSNIIAYSSRSSEPNIYLHDSETKKLLGVLPGKDVLVEYQDICFSRNGNYLVAIGGVGDHRIYIWDVKKRERLVWSREIQVPGFCSFVSFDPLDDSLLCVGGSFGMHFIRIQKEVDKIYGEIVSVCLKKDQKSRALEIENSNMFQKEESCEVRVFSPFFFLFSLFSSHSLTRTHTHNSQPHTGHIRFLKSRETVRQHR